eukprot:5570646-Amphidinium_carterae.1
MVNNVLGLSQEHRNAISNLNLLERPILGYPRFKSWGGCTALVTPLSLSLSLLVQHIVDDLHSEPYTHGLIDSHLYETLDIGPVMALRLCVTSAFVCLLLAAPVLDQD